MSWHYCQDISFVRLSTIFGRKRNLFVSAHRRSRGLGKGLRSTCERASKNAPGAALLREHHHAKIARIAQLG